MGLIPGLGRSPGGGNGNPLQRSCLEYPMDRGAWWAEVHRVTKSRTQLSTHTLQSLQRHKTNLYDTQHVQLFYFNTCREINDNTSFPKSKGVCGGVLLEYLIVFMLLKDCLKNTFQEQKVSISEKKIWEILIIFMSQFPPIFCCPQSFWYCSSNTRIFHDIYLSSS